MSLAVRLSDITTRIATEIKTLRTLINGNAVDLSALTTSSKSNLVAAINELVTAMGSAGVSINDAQISALTVWSSNKTDDEIDTRVGNAVTGLLNAAPAQFDTLKEIADRFASDTDVVAGLVSSIAAKAADNVVVKLTGDQSVGGKKTFTIAPEVPDASFAIAKVTGLTAALGAKVESSTIGDPETNLVTIFEAGLV